MSGNAAPLIVALPAEIDVTNSDLVLEQLAAAIGSGAAVVIADLTATTFCDTSGMRSLLLAHDKETDRTQLRVAVSPGSAVLRVFELAGTARLLRVYPSVEQASRGT
jgi:anti-sigma B factor antagonist